MRLGSLKSKKVGKRWKEHHQEGNCHPDNLFVAKVAKFLTMGKGFTQVEDGHIESQEDQKHDPTYKHRH